MHKVFLIGTVEQTGAAAAPTGAGIAAHFTLDVGGGAGETGLRFTIAVGPRALAELVRGRVRRGDLVFVEGRLMPQPPEGDAPAPPAILAQEVLVLSTPGAPTTAQESPAPGGQALVLAQSSAAALLSSLEALRTASVSAVEQALTFVGFPATPLWVELAPPRGLPSAYPFSSALVTADALGRSRCHLFSDEAEVGRLLVAADGRWTRTVPAHCARETPCQVAARALERAGAGWTRERVTTLSGTCPCARAALREAHFLFLIGHALAAPGLEREEFAGLPPLAQKWARARADLPWGQIPQRYASVSLITNGPALATGKEHASPRGAGEAVGAPPAEKQEQRTFSSYHRILIPGEGRPWLRFQVVFVPGNRPEEGPSPERAE
jgi:hypothetical protein